MIPEGNVSYIKECKELESVTSQVNMKILFLIK